MAQPTTPSHPPTPPIFAADSPELMPLAVWPCAQISAQYQRTGRYLPASSRHPGKMLPELARRLVAEYCPSGGLVADPMCGIGTTLVEAAALGRRAVGVELEARWANLARANLTHALPPEQANLGEVRQGDARQLTSLLADVAGQVDLVVTSPPYACDAGVIDKPAWRAGGSMCPRDSLNYSADPADLGRARGPGWHRAMAEVLAGCARLLRPEGLLVTVTKNTRRAGRLNDLAATTVSLAEAAGFGYLQHLVAVHAAVRDGGAGRPAVVLAAHPDPQRPRPRRALPSGGPRGRPHLRTPRGRPAGPGRRRPATGNARPRGGAGMTGTGARLLRVLSLGARVQSSTLLLMSLAGELPRLDAAVFADTGWEPAAVYAHLERLEVAAEAAGVPIYRVSAGNLRADALDPGHRFASMPLHVRRPDGKRGMIRRQCTREYKITPIRRQVRALWQAAGRPPVEQWLGISSDEPQRMRSSGVAYITHHYPLVDLGLTRTDCQRWLEGHGWAQVPRSACVGCPFRSDARWRELRDHAPTEWADAVAFDEAIRGGHVRLGRPALNGRAYLHRSLVPLDQADLKTPAAGSGAGSGLLEGFGNECQGVCAT